jgi:hypothetical protein
MMTPSSRRRSLKRRKRNWRSPREGKGDGLRKAMRKWRRPRKVQIRARRTARIYTTITSSSTDCRRTRTG